MVDQQDVGHCTRTRLPTSARAVVGVAAGIFLSVPCFYLLLRHWQTGADITAGIWRLSMLATALLATRWRMRGALAGLAITATSYATLHIWLDGPAALWHPAQLSWLLVSASIALAIGWLTERLSHADRVQHLITENLRLVQSTAAELERAEAKYRSLVQDGSDIITIVGADGLITYASPSVATVLGYAPDQLLGRPALSVIHPDDVAAAGAALEALLRGAGGGVPIQLRALHADDSWRYLEAVGQNQLANPSIGGLVLTARDITERKRAEERLEQQAFSDALTGLPNRALFNDRLAHALARSARDQRAVGVMFLDLDRFKIINDSLGHAVGDQLLQALSGRLQACLRAGDTLARLGGDEFTIVLEGLTDSSEASAVAERVLDALRPPFNLLGQEVAVSTSIGIVLSAPERQSPDELVRLADIALYRAKAAGRANYVFFEPSMNVDAVERLALESELRHALARDELRLHFQPEVDLASGRLVGAEALVRWDHPQRGWLLPGAFVPLAEETDLIVELGRWVLRAACRQGRAWQDACPGGPFMISVNLSARQLQQPDLVTTVAAALADTGLPAAALRLEITESVVVQEAQFTLDTLRALKALGVQLAIDDFGTGYSSLSYLTRLDVDVLKIDRAFISGTASGRRAMSVVGTIVSLAHALELAVTAEGIETAEQFAWVQALGCDAAQGYHVARPVDAATLDARLARERGMAASGVVRWLPVVAVPPGREAIYARSAG